MYEAVLYQVLNKQVPVHMMSHVSSYMHNGICSQISDPSKSHHSTTWTIYNNTSRRQQW